MRRELRRHAEWRGEISAMKTGATLGALHLEANTLKAALNPITVTAQTQVLPHAFPSAGEGACRCSKLQLQSAWMHICMG